MRRQSVLFLVFLFGCAGLMFFLPPAAESSSSSCPTTKASPGNKSAVTEWSSLNYVVSASVSGRFRDNLRPDLYYLTAFCAGGMTNELMCYANLIYLAMLSNRVPVVPPFVPSHHISSEGGMINFGEVFDLEHLRSVIRGPILEWSDIKANAKNLASPSFTTTEPLGCWASQNRDPHMSKPWQDHLDLDVSFTNVPWQLFIGDPASNVHIGFWRVAAFIFPQGEPLYGADVAVGVRWPSLSGLRMRPERHMACFDSTYYLATVEAFEWEREWSPAWRYVGTHLKFQRGIDELAVKYLRKLFEVPQDEAVPPFIAVHIRHGEFKNYCDEDELETCFVPVSTFAEAVEEVKKELLETRQIEVKHVLVSSDEESPAFWEETRAAGMVHIDHAAEQTMEKYGEWFPPIIDTAAHSHAMGVVGTHSSTLSLVSARRVRDWNNGVTREVRFKRS